MIEKTLTKKLKRSNFLRIDRSDSYIVRTQAGYRKLIKDHQKAWDVDEVEGTYPRKYPAMVSFTMGYSGYPYLRVVSIAIETIINTVKKSEEPIDGNV